jgi:hypothetical protein
MHIKLAILFGSSMVLIAATSASADGPLALTDFQLDGVTPLAQYSSAELFQLRITVENATDDEPDRARDAIVQEELETNEVESGGQATQLTATAQNASSETTMIPEPPVASGARNEATTWTGGNYSQSSRRTVAPEPTRWNGGTYGASSPRIPTPRPTLASAGREQTSATVGGARSTSAVSSSRPPSRARVAVSAPNRAWRSENPSMPRASPPALTSTSHKQPDGWAGGTQIPRAVRSASTHQSSLRARPAGAAQRANIAPGLKGVSVNVRSPATRILRSLPIANSSFSMRP